jgi:hypothetical protein
MANPDGPSSQSRPARPGVCVGPGSGSDHCHLFVGCSASKTQRWSRTGAGALSPVDPSVSGRPEQAPRDGRDWDGWIGCRSIYGSANAAETRSASQREAFRLVAWRTRRGLAARGRNGVHQQRLRWSDTTSRSGDGHWFARCPVTARRLRAMVAWRSCRRE